MLIRSVVVASTLACACAPTSGPPTELGPNAPYRGPILDVHVHAFSVAAQGPPPVGVCVGEASNLAYDSRRPWAAALLDLVKHPRCERPFWSPTTDEELRDQTLAELDRLDVTAVVSGEPDRVGEYWRRAPGLLPLAPAPGGPTSIPSRR